MPSIRSAIVLLFALALSNASEPAADALIAGDQVRIEVYNHPDLTSVQRIPAEGPLYLPLLGPVENVRGISADVLASRLRVLYERDYLQKAPVTVSVAEFARRNVYVMGEVAKPGVVTLEPGSPLTASRAIAVAGGLGEDADREGIKVLRDGIDGLPTEMKVPFTASANAIELVGDPRLRADDLVLVPRRDRAYLAGQIMKPGAMAIPADRTLTVSKAISLAGGFDRFAKQSEVQLLRRGEKPRTINVGAILDGGATEEDPLLLPGDTVFVPQRRF
jgi:polysaccharide biosynthesis/export protein